MIYKLTGSVLIVISVLYLVCGKLISGYFTYLLLEDVCKILSDMKTACLMGKTYAAILSDNTTYKYYNCGIIENLADKKQLEKCKSIINSTGRRNKKEELEYIDLLITQTETDKSKYKNYLESNRKTFFIAGISLGAITVIVLI